MCWTTVMNNILCDLMNDTLLNKKRLGYGTRYTVQPYWKSAVLSTDMVSMALTLGLLLIDRCAEAFTNVLIGMRLPR